jgi:hypothetical protein
MLGIAGFGISLQQVDQHFRAEEIVVAPDFHRTLQVLRALFRVPERRAAVPQLLRR